MKLIDLQSICMGNSLAIATKLNEHIITHHAVHHIARAFHPSRTTPGTRARKNRKRAAQTRGGRS